MYIYTFSNKPRLYWIILFELEGPLVIGLQMGDPDCAEAMMHDNDAKTLVGGEWVVVSREVAFQYFMAVDCDVHAPYYDNLPHLAKKFGKYEIWVQSGDFTLVDTETGARSELRAFPRRGA